MKKEKLSKVGKALLEEYLADGTIELDTATGEYVVFGGTLKEKCLGFTIDLPGICRYLEGRPTPDLW